MKRIKKIATGWLIVVVLCLCLCFGAAPLNAHATVQNQAVIGVSVPDNDEYSEIMECIFQANLDVGWKTSLYEEGELQDQIDGIYYLIDEGVDAIMVDENNVPALFSVFQDAMEEGVDIIVLGDYVPGCPEGVLFLSIDTYYNLGINHVNWVYRDTSMTGNATVYIFYHDAINGSFYRKGILDGLEDHNFSGTIKMAAIDTRQDLDTALNVWFGDGDDAASSINEIVTHSSALAEAILQRYYLEGYTDADSGTGIRAFSTPSGETRTRSAEPSLEEVLDEKYEAYLSDATQTIGNALAEYLNGEEISGAQLINGCYVLSCGFGPGYARYVSC